MEICAIDVCRRCTRRIAEVYELEAICRLYRVIFQARHIRAKIEDAVNIGFQSIKIASMLRNFSLRLDLMPDLIFALIQLNRLAEAASLLHELEFTSQLDSDKTSRIWYYALCLDFQLDTGFTVIPYEMCQIFVREEEENFVTLRDPRSKNRIYTSLWLWCIRYDEWEHSKSYSKTLKNCDMINERETPCSVYTRLKRLEGFLITLVHRMDIKNIYAITSTYAEIHALMTKLEKDIQLVKLLKPRFLLLKAYYRQIRYRDDSCFRILNQALSMAEKMQDKNTYEWIVHLQMVWSNAISPIQRDYWIEHCRYNLIDWHESDGMSKKQTVMYSLPLPKF
ncbi:hypothetical protein RUM43_004045 [Polyplax serrata]|uniref:Uncharacterized protein n=1 Tax=Polyplax serrata TaxID=468196 RepID=A0AAN8SAG7_POLSC